MKTIALIIWLLLIGTAAYVFWKNNRVPEHLGVHDGRLSELPSSPNAVSSQTSDQIRFVPALSLIESQEQTISAIKQALESMETSESFKIVNEQPAYMHVVFTTSTMRYKDDVEFLLKDQFLHFRSASRIGHDDMGANRTRYKAFAKAYNELLEP